MSGICEYKHHNDFLEIFWFFYFGDFTGMVFHVGFNECTTTYMRHIRAEKCSRSRDGFSVSGGGLTPISLYEDHVFCLSFFSSFVVMFSQSGSTLLPYFKAVKECNSD